MLLSFVRLSRDSVIVIAVDLRERMRAEADRARYQRELEEKVADRTRELLESRARLIEHERLAVVGTLAAGVAHQINNPIGAILNCCEYALVCRDDEDSRATLRAGAATTISPRRGAVRRSCGSMLQFSRDQPTSKWIEDLEPRDPPRPARDQRLRQGSGRHDQLLDTGRESASRASARSSSSRRS